jgi:hypothetical protein
MPYLAELVGDFQLVTFLGDLDKSPEMLYEPGPSFEGSSSNLLNMHISL